MAGIGALVKVELYINSVWTDITTDVRVDPGIEIGFGVRGESGTADPSECRLVVNNRNGNYTPKNPVGAYYGYLKRNTPLRVSVNSVVRYVGEVSEFPSRWEPSAGDVWEPLVASGTLRRLLRAKTLQSTLSTYFQSNSNVIAYWPMVDADGSTSLASGLGGGTPMTFDAATAPDLAAFDPGPASEPIPTWAGAFAGPTAIAATPGSTGFSVAFNLAIPTAGTANDAELIRIFCTGPAGGGPNDVTEWLIQYRTGGFFRLYGRTQFGPVLDSGDLYHVLNNGVPRTIVFEVQDVGADLRWYLSSDVGTSTAPMVGYQTTAPVGIRVGSPVSAGLPALTGAVAIGQVAVAKTVFAYTPLSFDAAKTAFAGETVEARMARIAAQAGFAMTVDNGGDSATTLLGPQPDGTPLDVLRDAEQADMGLLRDSISTPNALLYTTLWATYSLSAILALDYASGHLSPPLEPTDDDAVLANDVTVTRPNGSSARAVDTTSALSSLAWPAGVGVYELPYTANVKTDAQLPDIASRLLYKGTLDKTRFPTITVDLIANPSLVTNAEAMRPGYLLTVANLPPYAGADSARLKVMGWTEYLSSHSRVITFNCRPAEIEDVIHLDDTFYGRLDSSATVTNEPLDATETGVDYTGDTWITTALNPTMFPVPIVIGGERMSLTSATGATFTVTRSVNGVVKTHLTGVPVNLANPIRLAL